MDYNLSKTEFISAEQRAKTQMFRQIIDFRYKQMFECFYATVR